MPSLTISAGFQDFSDCLLQLFGLMYLIRNLPAFSIFPSSEFTLKAYAGFRAFLIHFAIFSYLKFKLT